MCLLLNISLNTYNPKHRLCLISDSSLLSYSFGCLAYNKTTDSMEIISLYTKLHNRSHYNRSILGKECISIAQNINLHSSYIMNNERTVYLMTDVIILQYLKSFSSTNETLMNLSLLLTKFGDHLQIITAPSACNYLSDCFSRLVTVKYLKPELSGQHLSRSFWPKKMILNNRHITDILFPSKESNYYLDANPKVSYKDIPRTSSLNCIADIFREPNELQWLKLAVNIDRIDKDHSLWQTFRAGKKISISQLQELRRKYKLNEAHFSSALMYNKFVTLNKSVFLCTKESEYFVDQVIKLLNVTNQVDNISWLTSYPTAQEDDKLSILSFCEDLLFQQYNIQLGDNMSSYICLVPIIQGKKSAVLISKGVNCLEVYLLQPLEMKANSLHIIYLDILIFCDSLSL